MKRYDKKKHIRNDRRRGRTTGKSEKKKEREA